MPEADALIVFSCAGRLMALGPLMTEEIRRNQKRMECSNGWNV